MHNSDSSGTALWQKVVQRLRSTLKSQASLAWLDSIEVEGFDGQELRLKASNRLALEWMRDHQADSVRSLLHYISGEPVALSISIGGSAPEAPRPPRGVHPPVSEGPGLVARYTFENFKVAPSNEFAHAAALAVARSPGRDYNPLVIYGGIGLGKTHLLTAVAHEIRERSPDVRVLYTSSERFTNDMIRAISSQRTAEMRRRYRDQCDVLLVDDIQFFAGKEKTQEEFFYTFNTLFDSSRQIAVTCNASPQSIPKLDERISSRLSWGLVVDIRPPELELKVAILRSRSEAEGLSIPEDVCFYLGSLPCTNIRELEGYMTKVAAYASLRGKTPSLELAKEALRDTTAAHSSGPSIKEILDEVARAFEVKPSDLKSRDKRRKVSWPRQIAMFLARDLTGASFPDIGDQFGGKDHSTVIHACSKVASVLEKDPALRSRIDELRRGLRAR